VTKRKNIPHVPLSQHGLIPAVLEELKGWGEMCSDKGLVGKMVAILDTDEDHAMERLRTLLGRVVFHAPLPADFNSGKFHYLSNLLMMELEHVVMPDPGSHVVRRIVPMEEAARVIAGDWASRRLSGAF
jgi:hypothetical protein